MLSLRLFGYVSLLYSVSAAINDVRSLMEELFAITHVLKKVFYHIYEPVQV